MQSEYNVVELIIRNKEKLQKEWYDTLLSSKIKTESGKLPKAVLEKEIKELIDLFIEAIQIGDIEDITVPSWGKTLDRLKELSSSRAKLGFTPSATAIFIMAVKNPLMLIIQKEFKENTKDVMDNIWTLSLLIDKLALYTTDTFLKTKELLIKQQQEDMLELSTPVIKLWDGILALPLIGTLDSLRTQTVMENLLQTIIDTGSEFAIIDITGVPAVDTQVAQHLLKTVAATRLMGAQCLISGIRPQIAQTMIHLGVTFGDVVTKATLADAFAYALKKMDVSLDHK